VVDFSSAGLSGAGHVSGVRQLGRLAEQHLWPYISPFYSPEIYGDSPHAMLGPKPSWYPNFLPFSPALLILWIPGLRPPVAAFPSNHPLRNSLPDVLGVRRDFYFARLLEREESLDRRHQLHSIVGGVRIVPEEFLLHRAESQDAGPPSRTGISEARSIGNQRSLLHGLWDYDDKSSQSARMTGPEALEPIEALAIRLGV
jgi:hypothetical protein